MLNQNYYPRYLFFHSSMNNSQLCMTFVTLFMFNFEIFQFPMYFVDTAIPLFPIPKFSPIVEHALTHLDSMLMITNLSATSVTTTPTSVREWFITLELTRGRNLVNVAIVLIDVSNLLNCSDI